MNIPESMVGSPALQFIQSRGWTIKSLSVPNAELDVCPYCDKSGGGHFYIELHGPLDGQPKRDGLNLCHKCGQGGSLYSLKQKLGLGDIPGVQSRSDWIGVEKTIEQLPDVEQCHLDLLADEDAMDYLVNTRGFSRDIIVKQKLGITKKYFRECGEVKCLIYPYLVNGNCTFVHYRTLPPSPKAFTSPKGWPVPLYNQEVLKEGITEIVLVEGEANVIAALDKGYTNICGVPGANVKKAEWIELLDKLELERIYICYDNDKVGQKAAQSLASRIGVEKCWKVQLPKFTVQTEEGEKQGKDLNEWFVQDGTSETFTELLNNSSLFDVDGVSSSGDALQDLEDMINGKEGLSPTYVTPWPSLNKHVGFDEGDVCDIIAPSKVGKGQTLNALIKTPTEWVKMGDLKLGDKLASIDGEPSIVTGLFPLGNREIFRVTFSDGRYTDVTNDHLWKVAGAQFSWERQQWRIYTTDALINEYFYDGCRKNQKIKVPLMSGIFGGEEELLIDPWLLGVLIGDGSLNRHILSFSSMDSEVINRVSTICESYGHEVKLAAKYSYQINKNSSSYLHNSLEKYGLLGHTAESKFIPKMYLEGSKDQRLELLRGLLDTDGTASNKHGVISYCTISKQLADDVVYLVRSLGGIAKVSPPQKKSFRYKGELRTGQPAYIIVVRMPERTNLFTIQRKLDRVKERIKQPCLTIKSIKSVGFDEAQCISVSHPSQLYITDNFIVTHNTTFALNLLEHMVDHYGEDGVLICLEMTTMKLARKWVSHVAGVADNIPNSPEEAIALKNEFLEGIKFARTKAGQRDSDLYFCYPKYKTMDDLYKLIIAIIRRYGVKWIVFDNIQRACDSTIGSKNRTQHLSEISKVTSQIAKDYLVQMIRIIQPHAIKPGQTVQAEDADGSSQISKDCDSTITLHRNKINVPSGNDFEVQGYVEGDSSFDDKMLATVGLSRYSSGGYTTLRYDGARSSIYEFNMGEIAKFQSEMEKGVGHESRLKEIIGDIAI